MALIILTACSGTGKSTIVKALMSRFSKLRLSVSHTTRKARPGEVDGQAYHFIDRDQFQTMIATEAFVEWAEYAGNYYGTSHQVIQDAESSGIDLLFEVDVVGAEALKKSYPQALSCFLLPPSWEELERRLRDRQTETEKVILKRLAVGREEVKYAPNFDYILVNDQLDEAIEDMGVLYRALQLRTDHQTQVLKALI